MMKKILFVLFLTTVLLTAVAYPTAYASEVIIVKPKL